MRSCRWCWRTASCRSLMYQVRKYWRSSQQRVSHQQVPETLLGGSMTTEKLPDADTYYLGIALAVREKANCTGNRVGAVLVLENRVISTGYNGVPEGMKNC